MPKADVRQPILDIELALTDAKDYQLESALQQFNRFKREATTNLTEDMIKSCIRGINTEIQRREAEKHYQDSLIVSNEHTSTPVLITGNHKHGYSTLDYLKDVGNLRK